TVEPSLAGPKRPQDRVTLSKVKASYEEARLGAISPKAAPSTGGGTAVAAAPRKVKVNYKSETFELGDGAVVIAAITSCTNTSNPSVMLAAGLVAQKANARGLKSKPWVKTSLAPGSKVVTDYLAASGLDKHLEA